MIRMYEYGTVPNETLFIRSPLFTDVGPVVSEILRDVKENGDAALYRLTEKFDGAKLASLEVSRGGDRGGVQRRERGIPRGAAARARQHPLPPQPDPQRLPHDAPGRRGDGPEGHADRPRGSLCAERQGGVSLHRADELCPREARRLRHARHHDAAGPDGRSTRAILAAAKIAGVDRIFKIGGAQAVAALAYGTESVPKVDKIVGPGGAFVAEAKRQVFGRVSIDMIAGPSEVLVVADGTNDPPSWRRTCLRQAEHDIMAPASW